MLLWYYATKYNGQSHIRQASITTAQE